VLSSFFFGSEVGAPACRSGRGVGSPLRSSSFAGLAGVGEALLLDFSQSGIGPSPFAISESFPDFLGASPREFLSTGDRSGPLFSGTLSCAGS
jgi:hypothetical protein